VDWTGAVTAWDAASGRELRVFRHASGILTSVAISPDGRLAASTGNTGQTEIWDLRTGREVRKIENAGEGVAFSPDGRRLATGSPDRLVRLWDVATGRELLALPGHRTEARWIAFSRDGHRLVTADIRGTTLLWGGASPLAPAAGAAWPPSGNLIVNGSFEQGDDLDGGWRVVEAGSNQIPGWEVSAGNVDRVSSHLLTSWDGEAVLDLDGIRRGAIRQTFPTVPGQSYRITFRMAGNLFAAPRYKEMRLTVAGTSQVYRFDTDSRTAGEPGWTACEWRFTARAALTTLEFASLNPEESAAGVVLDGVAVVPAPAR